MIKQHCFTDQWLEAFKKQKEHGRIDKIILEKMIYALHLLEQLKLNGLQFVFKGGTSLLLLLQEGNRFSIDIDIICNTDRVELERIFQQVVASSNFTGYELEETRSYTPGVPKAHYKFSFKSGRQGSGTILLDILIEDSIYPKTISKPMATKWIETEGETMIELPSMDAITGDKLTAFAPNTIGIPYFKKGQAASMEICKQLYDLSKLFERIDNMEIVAASFSAFAAKEIGYRNDESLTPEKVLQDTIDTCAIIARRGGEKEDEKAQFLNLAERNQCFWQFPDGRQLQN
jgi:predicted nucleotidyltransferase component of viral defense system